MDLDAFKSFDGNGRPIAQARHRMSTKRAPTSAATLVSRGRHALARGKDNIPTPVTNIYFDIRQIGHQHRVARHFDAQHERDTIMTKKTLLGLVPLALLTVVAGACSSGSSEGSGSNDPTASGSDKLTTSQCSYFAVDGKTQICHATASEKNPYTSINVDAAGCADHAAHPGDYVAVNDPGCTGGSCLPKDAPCDATLPCCDGLTCQNGICAAPSVCQNFTGTGCYWMENTSGNFCWVPSPSGFPATVADCKGLDSCTSNGGGLSGGGCYRWANCSLCSTIFPDPLWP
jgi:hypothetical protein